MTTTDIIKEILAERRWSRRKLAEEMGLKRESNVGVYLDRGSNLRIDTLVKIADAMGCEIVIRDKFGSNKEWKVSL